MAPSTPALLGPPEIYQSAAAPSPAPAAPTASGDPLVDLMVANFNNTAIQKTPPMGKTENYSPTFTSTGNPCLDFFFHVVPNTPPETLNNRLQVAWDHDRLKALKLVANLRGVRGTGKSDKEGFYTAALWLHKNHPKTLACNVATFAEFGYFTDLLEILFRLLEGANARKVAEEKKKSVKVGAMRQRRRGNYCRSPTGSISSDYSDYGRSPSPPRRRSVKAGAMRQRGVGVKAKALKMSREEKRIEKAKRVVEKFISDSDFRFLHERVSDLFAQCLRSDMKLLNSGDLCKISLASKCCPSLDSSFDRITLLCETIAKKVFPREEYPEYEGTEETHYTYRVRDRLRKEVLVPLRKALQLPEVYMGANDWGSIPYERVASDALKKYKDKFLKHDKERFQEYLAKVKSGEAKIAVDALLPREIIAAGGEVAELQWKRMVEDMANKGKLSNSLAVCDVSRSMDGIPKEVSLALGVLVSELSQGPWKGKLITFSESPKLQIVEGDSLSAKTEFVRKETEMKNAGYHNKDFQKVFDVLLKVAVKGKLKGDEMIKRVFVLSDMEFASQNQNRFHLDTETDYESIVRKFRENGYGEWVPEIVFWNLRDSKATPVPGNQPGVALLSGFSKNLMTLFLEEGGALDPEALMEAAISGEEYHKLAVVD